MTSTLRRVATLIACRLPVQPGLRGQQPVALFYHGISRTLNRLGLGAEEFESQIRFLSDRYELVSPASALERKPQSRQVRVLLTFDDGFRNNAEVAAPILEKYEVPAIFFVSTRHLTPGKFLWFAYLRALGESFSRDGFQFRGEWMDMHPNRRASTVLRLRNYLLALKPHPARMYEAIENELPNIMEFTTEFERVDRYEGMSHEQLRCLASHPLFTIGGHTVDHPFLTKCEPNESYAQMLAGRSDLQVSTGVCCDLFAYPAGDFDPRIAQECRDSGFRSAFSVHNTLAHHYWKDMAIPRMGVYYPGVSELGFKVQWSGLLRFIRR